MENLFLFLSAVLGAALGFLIQNRFPLVLKYLLAFSGAYVFALLVLHLFPEVFHSNESIGIYVLIGFLLQLCLEFFSKGLEHGHLHKHDSQQKPLIMISALWLHAFLEGMPVGTHSHLHGLEEGISPFLSGLILHKIPIGMIFFFLLKDLKYHLGTKIALFLLFALAAPMGSLAASYISVLAEYALALNALVLGILLHISTTILFESSSSHAFNRAKIIIVLGGAALAWFSIS